MNSYVRETLVQVLRLLITVVERWGRPEGEALPDPSERLPDPAAPERERRRERLRKRGIPVPGDSR